MDLYRYYISIISSNIPDRMENCTSPVQAQNCLYFSIPADFIYIVIGGNYPAHARSARAVNDRQSPTVGPGKDFSERKKPVADA